MRWRRTARVSASSVGLLVSVDPVYRYQPDKQRDDPVIAALQAVVSAIQPMASGSCQILLAVSE